jgi:hypothetical protein
MDTFLIILGLSIVFMFLAFFGLAIKTIFKKGGRLTTCSGSEGCGCDESPSCKSDK